MLDGSKQHLQMAGIGFYYYGFKLIFFFSSSAYISVAELGILMVENSHLIAKK